MNESPELVTERHSWILERVSETRRVVTTDAASELSVSVDTIRRDLRTLHDRGLIRRVHGGAVPVSSLPDSFSGRTGDEESRRPTLATAVVQRLQPGQVVGLDAGTTSVAIASLIPPTLAITIVTNNPAVAVTLADHRSAQVILLGGKVDLTWMATVGAETVDGWRNYRIDVGIVGLCGFDPISGGTTNSHAEVATKRALIASSAETIIPMQAEKLGTAAPFLVAEPISFDTIIVEPPTDPDFMHQCSKSNIEVVVAT